MNMLMNTKAGPILLGSRSLGFESRWIISEPKLRFIAQSCSYSPLHRPDMNEILLKPQLIRPSFHPSILQMISVYILLTIIPVLADNGSFVRANLSRCHGN